PERANAIATATEIGRHDPPDAEARIERAVGEIAHEGKVFSADRCSAPDDDAAVGLPGDPVRSAPRPDRGVHEALHSKARVEHSVHIHTDKTDPRRTRTVPEPSRYDDPPVTIGCGGTDLTVLGTDRPDDPGTVAAETGIDVPVGCVAEQR